MMRVNQKSPIAPRRPKFRLFAATIMLGLIIAASVTMLLGMWVALRETVIRMNFAQVSELGGDVVESRGIAALVWAFLNQQSVFRLVGAAMAMLLIAWLLRAVVLKGLRD